MSSTYDIASQYYGSSASTCSGAPDIVAAMTLPICVESSCTSTTSDTTGLTYGLAIKCGTSDSISKALGTLYGTAQYFGFESYSDSACKTLSVGGAYKANTCVTTGASASVKIVVNSDGSVTMNTYTKTACAGTATSGNLASSAFSSSACKDISSTGLGTYGRYYTGWTTGTASGNAKSSAVSSAVSASALVASGFAAAMIL